MGEDHEGVLLDGEIGVGEALVQALRVLEVSLGVEASARVNSHRRSDYRSRRQDRPAR
jgi:hypothetical protein